MAASDDFGFGLDYDEAMPWIHYLELLESQRRGVGLAADRVPATFLVAEAAGRIVGRLSIRHELDEHLARQGRHIGYGVLAGHRRRGLATAMLRDSLTIGWSLGIDRALLVCDDDNVGSATVIERCGGVLDSIGEDEAGGSVRRYWIT